MSTTKEQDEQIANMSFTKIYPLYVAKVSKKGRTEQELIQVISWLTGYDKGQIQGFVQDDVTFRDFFKGASIHPNSFLITGKVCGFKVEDIQTPLTRHARYLDKLVDELAKGKQMEKILRTP
ncbi:DUF2200 domain-containing protein [Aliagarivorans marinus]|uniref:DUF2200 domain-containing protein n=1 Tax=Aliagarivorans marinus TaxID=561965 RepID=UPI00040D4C0F|nr:DUF2200 domain-containing protein [Aliagarivorans marinus]